VDVLHGDVSAEMGKRRPGRAGGSEEPNGCVGEAFAHQLAHDGAHLASRANNSQSESHRPVPPYTTASPCSESKSNAVWTARTASSNLSARVTTETRMSEVEIISILIPASRKAAKNFALTPDEDRMPAPTSDSLPIASSVTNSS